MLENCICALKLNQFWQRSSQLETDLIHVAVGGLNSSATVHTYTLLLDSTCCIPDTASLLLLYSIQFVDVGELASVVVAPEHRVVVIPSTHHTVLIDP